MPPDMSTNIYLIGMMGAGKTTLGRQLARRLSWPFIDIDHEIQSRAGATIPTIFELEQEAGFRKRETAALEDIAQLRGQVVATGGGIVMAPHNRLLLSQSGFVVYLNVPSAVLVERTRHDRNRPLLQVEDPRARIESLHALRDPLYREIADIILDCGRGSPAVVVSTLEQELKQRCVI
jgi:shikimate kinase